MYMWYNVCHLTKYGCNILSAGFYSQDYRTMAASSQMPPPLHLRADATLTQQGMGEWHTHTYRTHEVFLTLHLCFSPLLPPPRYSPAVLWWWAPPLSSSLCCSLDSILLSLLCTPCRRSRRKLSTGSASSDSTNSLTNRCSASWKCRSEYKTHKISKNIKGFLL